MCSFLSLIISFLALIGGLSSWLYIWYMNRVNFSLSIYAKLISSKGILLYLCFANESRLPISLTKISLLQGDDYISCKPIPELVFQLTSRTGDTITNKEKHYSLQIPINLDSLSASSGYLYFPLKQEIVLQNASALTFEVQTNRGETKQMTLELPQKNLH